MTRISAFENNFRAGDGGWSLYFFGKIYFKRGFVVRRRAAKYIAVMVYHNLFCDSEAHARAAVLYIPNFLE